MTTAPRGLEEERQERAAEQDDDEAVERDLAEHERPVVGEDLAAELLDEARDAGALVDVVGRPVGELHARCWAAAHPR